ncbi:unnamed protein product [Rhizophagus irregularis]|nr:unnamed protein product [Rhizophagus irregularis]
MVRKTRSDKKDTICKRCGYECSTPQKLREHLKRKNLCKPLQKQKEVANQQAIQASKIKAQVIPTLVPELELEKEVPILGVDYITEEEAKNWVKLDLGIEPYEANDLDGCKTLFHDLELNDPEAVRLPTLKELESEGGPRPKTQSSRKGNKSKNLINKEFKRLGEIKRHERSEKNLEFREQEELGIAVKRRVIAIHRAKVSKSHPDNGSDIRKILESRRKQFREILEKKFDKRGQFKFALCSLTKFLIDDKPGKEKQGKKNSRTDWLRNKQIIVYIRDEIDDYLSNAFEQILYQVEERGGKSNA